MQGVSETKYKDPSDFINPWNWEVFQLTKMHFSIRNCFVICFLLSLNNFPAMESRMRRCAQCKLFDNLALEQAILQFKRQWRSLFDKSHLQPKLKNNFELGKAFNNKASYCWQPHISMGNIIAHKRGDLAPLQSYLLFQDFDSSLIKTNTYRAQLIG